MNTQQEAAEREALLPCPFCGHVGLDFTEGSTFRWRIAQCAGCGATTGEERIQTTGEGTKEEWEAVCRARLIAAWNRRATLSQQGGGAVAPGYKVVPVEPTPEMLTAAGPMSNYDFEAPGASPDADHAEWYRAMLAAAPPAPQEAREPLTEAQIRKIWLEGKDHGDDWLDMLGITRDIEAAHGIAATAKGERG